MAHKFLTIPSLEKGAFHDSDKISKLNLSYCSSCYLIFINNKAKKIPTSNSQSFSFLNNRELNTFRKSISKNILRQIEDLSGQKKSQLSMIDVGAGDGYFASLFKNKISRILCLEPNINEVRKIKRRKLCVVGQGLDLKWAQKSRSKYNLVLCTQVLEHEVNPLKFMNLLRQLLRPEGLLYLEVPSLEYILENHQYFAFYPEHVCYFSLQALTRLMTNQWNILQSGKGFNGQFNWILVQANKNYSKDNWGQTLHLAQQGLQDNLKKFMKDKKRNGLTFAMWGAGAKGKTMLVQNRILSGAIDYLVDKDKTKWGKSFLGHSIYSTKIIENRPPDVILISAFTYAEQVKRDLKKLKWKGQLWQLTPELTISSFS